LYNADRRIFHFAHENPDVPHDDEPALPKTDIFFSTLVLLQTGQGGSSLESRETSSSYSMPHFLHLYSYIGITGPCSNKFFVSIDVF
jgi:hypothetical protein